jgi:aryl carrier-like protein
MWFEGLSPRDLNHVLSLIDMGMDSIRISRAEAMSCKSLVVDLDSLS